ncbi:MAG: hypothetical protein AB4042_14055 [Leptolyngbyaceae cyanobacterium]
MSDRAQSSDSDQSSDRAQPFISNGSSPMKKSASNRGRSQIYSKVKKLLAGLMI